MKINTNVNITLDKSEVVDILKQHIENKLKVKVENIDFDCDSDFDENNFDGPIVFQSAIITIDEEDVYKLFEKPKKAVIKTPAVKTTKK